MRTGPGEASIHISEEPYGPGNSNYAPCGDAICRSAEASDDILKHPAFAGSELNIERRREYPRLDGQAVVHIGR
jgi:hypothetical protein